MQIKEEGKNQLSVFYHRKLQNFIRCYVDTHICFSYPRNAANIVHICHITMLASLVVEIIKAAGHPIESHQIKSSMEQSGKL